MKHATKILATGALILSPFAVSAQGPIVVIFDRIEDTIAALFPIIFALALLAFMWGAAKFIFNAGSESGRQEGKKIMIWGIIGLFVLVSIWGIVRFIQNEVGGSLSNPPSHRSPPAIINNQP